MTCALSLILFAVAGHASAAGRVVFCEKGAQYCPEPRRVLGKSARGSWALVDDRALLANATAAMRLPHILYFTLGDYEDAIAGLNSKEREAAILRRREVLLNDSPASPLGLVDQDLRQIASAVRDLDNDDFVLVLDAAMGIAGGTSRFTTIGPTEALSQSRETLSPILVELDDRDIASGYRREAAILAKIEANLAGGRPQATPFASPTRAYFVPGVPAGPRHPTFVDQPSYGWGGGSVQALRPSEAATSPWKESKPRLFYYSRQLFFRDITALTPAQIDRRLRVRLAGPPKHELAEWIAILAFRYTVSLRQYTEVVRRAKVPWLADWNEAVALNVQNLRRALADAQPDAPAERKARIGKLRADLPLVAAMIHGVPFADTYLESLSRVTAIVARLSD